MKYVHTITLSVFVKLDDLIENPELNEKIESIITEMLPLDWQKEKVDYKKIKAEGLEGRHIIIHELKLHKEKETNTFLQTLLKKLTKEQKELLLREEELRLDENDDFFIRLDKDKLLRGIYEITTGGNCFHIRMNIAAFPKKREVAIKVIREILTR
jgi:hypothetical protein